MSSGAKTKEALHRAGAELDRNHRSDTRGVKRSLPGEALLACATAFARMYSRQSQCSLAR